MQRDVQTPDKLARACGPSSVLEQGAVHNSAMWFSEQTTPPSTLPSMTQGLACKGKQDKRALPHLKSKCECYCEEMAVIISSARQVAI